MTAPGQETSTLRPGLWADYYAPEFVVRDTARHRTFVEHVAPREHFAGEACRADAVGRAVAVRYVNHGRRAI